MTESKIEIEVDPQRPHCRVRVTLVSGSDSRVVATEQAICDRIPTELLSQFKANRDATIFRDRGLQARIYKAEDFSCTFSFILAPEEAERAQAFQLQELASSPREYSACFTCVTHTRKVLEAAGITIQISDDSTSALKACLKQLTENEG